MAYTLSFSDPSKITTIPVPDMPPGINAIDTSLSFVGKGYPNYGQVVDTNFLHLLENFASPLPPTNPIEGQLWYDTSNPDNKVLRIMDGSAGAVSWPSANGIYQQPTDPASTTSRLKNGDLWVNTKLNQLNIYSSGSWIAISEVRQGALNGSINTIVNDSTGNPHYITQNYVDGTIVSIVSMDNFIPNPIIAGFGQLIPGINIYNGGLLAGTALAASSLAIQGAVFAASTFLRKDDNSANQVITGRMLFSTPNYSNQAGAQGRDGVVINVFGGDAAEYVQLYKLGSDAILLNNKAGGSIRLQTLSSTNNLPNDTLIVSNKVVAINTTTSANSPNLDVYGSARILNTLTITTTASMALSLGGGATINGDLTVGGAIALADDITVSGQVYVNWLDTNGTPKAGSAILPSTTELYDIGSSSKKFNRVYSKSFGTVDSQYFGVFNGPATQLAQASNFRMIGQVTATNFAFYGSGTTATFSTTLDPSAISAQPVATTCSDTMTFIAIDTSTSAVYSGIQRVTRAQINAGVYLPGMIMPYGGNVVPSGWLACDGATYTVSQYPYLADALQNQGTGNFIYGGTVPYFNVPNLSTATSVTKQIGANYLTYIIKT